MAADAGSDLRQRLVVERDADARGGALDVTVSAEIRIRGSSAAGKPPKPPSRPQSKAGAAPGAAAVARPPRGYRPAVPGKRAPSLARLLGSLLWAAVRQVLPEPGVRRAYRPPSEYKTVDGEVAYSDGMTADYRPNLFTRAFAAVTLGLYVGVPNIIGLLILTAWWSAAARVLLLAIFATSLLPLRPLFWRRVMNSYVFLAWRRYFNFSYVFDKSLDPYADYVIAQFPHGAFPLGSLVSGTFMATEYPEYTCYALAANNSFLVPVWRHVHTWMGTMAATPNNFRRLLALGTCRALQAARSSSSGGGSYPDDGWSEAGTMSRTASDAAAAAAAPAAAPLSRAASEGCLSACGAAPALASGGGSLPLPLPIPALPLPGRRSRLRKRNPQGVSVAVMVGGIAEMYLQHRDFERIKLLDRKGFVRIAVEHGTDILPVYNFGVSQMMSFGPPWLMDAARKLRMSIGLLYGVCGTTIPHRVPLRMAVGVPVPVGPALPPSDPGFNARVEQVHAAVVEAIRKVYYTHRDHYGWGDRELVIV